MGLQPSGSNNHGIPITQMQAFQAMMGKVRRAEPGGGEEGGDRVAGQHRTGSQAKALGGGHI